MHTREQSGVYSHEYSTTATTTRNNRYSLVTQNIHTVGTSVYHTGKCRYQQCSSTGKYRYQQYIAHTPPVHKEYPLPTGPAFRVSFRQTFFGP